MEENTPITPPAEGHCQNSQVETKSPGHIKDISFRSQPVFTWQQPLSYTIEINHICTSAQIEPGKPRGRKMVPCLFGRRLFLQSYLPFPGAVSSRVTENVDLMDKIHSTQKRVIIFCSS